MAIYVNKTTKDVVVTSCELIGDWELQDNQDDNKDLTVKELQSLLTGMGVDYDSRAKKPDLLALYEANK